MSDFLTNLAARALGAPTLRPRTRSRFEPEPGASSWIEAPADPVIERAAEAAHEPASRPAAEPATRSVPERPAPRRPDHPSRSPRALENDLAPSPRQRGETRSAEAAPPLLKTEVLPHHSTTIAKHTEHHTTERVVERAIEHHDHTVVRVERETPSRPVVEPASERPEDSPATPRPDDSPPRHRYDEQPPRIERERREALPGREPRPAPPSSARIEAAAVPEPTIHVSIGRVEVRAAAPAATPQRTRTRNAPMTIEDYAARRNAKGRP